MACKRKLAPGQWWAFCGETNMGQSEPALCMECGGEYVLDPLGGQKRIEYQKPESKQIHFGHKS